MNEDMNEESASREERDRLDAELAHRVAELPREIDPPRDLWPEIAARLEPRHETLGQVVPFRRRAARVVAAVVPASPAHAVAALLWMSLGGVLAWWVLGGIVGPAPGVPDPRGAPGLAVPAAMPSETVSAGAGGAEMQYLRAKEELFLLALEARAERDRFSPEAWEVVRRNLEILDVAIGDLRDALRQDPGNAELEARLLESHRRGLALLRRLTDEV